MSNVTKLLLFISVTATLILFIYVPIIKEDLSAIRGYLPTMMPVQGRGAGENDTRWNVENDTSGVEREHFLFIVMILSHRASDRIQSRSAWNNPTFWATKNVTTKILYVVGSDQVDSTEQDIIIADMVESRCALKHKVQAGLRYIKERYSCDYILKTDVDVFNDYKAWTEAILRYNDKQINAGHSQNGAKNNVDSHSKSEQSAEELHSSSSSPPALLYGGGGCRRHLDVPYPFCSGMGYILHSSLLDHVISYPLSKMEGAEDRTVGKCMSEVGVKPVGILTGSVRGLKGEECEGLGGLMKEHGTLHTGRDSGKMLECWNAADLSAI
ncbi:uncharacterized protein LOC134825565 [Bolinopsis microptera]|uniref:uncharacterized protein LOC134825565 n=1 Tax=Bolinopsis microptera TaxID=2820187 RepID=UPI00307952CB